jgi:hypothetical protein
MAGNTGDEESGRIKSLDELHAKVDEALERLKDLLPAGGRGEKEGSPAPPAARSGSPAPASQSAAATAEDRRREIREELGNLKKQEQADAEQQALLERLDAVEERTAEKPPRQLRRVEQFFGWGGE